MSGQESTVAPSGLDASFQESLAEAGADLETEAPATGDGADQEASPDDEPRFTDTNPDDLPEASQQHYKQFQRDYTKKMQALASDRKALEAKAARIKAWEPAMEAYDRNPELRARVDAAYDRAEKAAVDAGATAPSDFEKFLEQYDEPSQKVLRALGEHTTKQAEAKAAKILAEQKAELEKVNDQIAATQRAFNEQQANVQQKRFEKAHPTWKEDLTPRQQKLFMMELWENPETEPSEVYEAIVEEFDKGASKAAEKVVKTLVDKASNRPVRSPGRVARGAETFNSMHDAFQSAMREHGR